MFLENKLNLFMNGRDIMNEGNKLQAGPNSGGGVVHRSLKKMSVKKSAK